MKLLGDNINEGDVILCNHPSCGGSHLPDLTVITPVMFPLFVFCYLNFLTFFLAVCLFVCLFVYLFVCLSVCLSVCHVYIPQLFVLILSSRGMIKKKLTF